MATSLTVNSILAKVGWSFTSTVDGLTDSTSNVNNFTYTKSMTNGTGASASRYIYAKQHTIAGGATLNLDLAGSLTDFYGTTITFTKVKVIYVELATTTTATSIKVGGHATAGLANWITSADTLDNDQPGVVVRNGGCFLLACTDATGYAVTATTEDILSIVNQDGSNSATVNVCIIGE